MITCRVCDLQAPAHDDAILLCDHCRADVEATRAHLERVVTKAARRMAEKLEQASTADTRRYYALRVARNEARRLGTLPAFERRYQATLAVGDALSDLLDAESTLLRLREWSERAAMELDALAEVATERAA